jgi:glycerophosphoryl diester phosphodiesterase
MAPENTIVSMEQVSFPTQNYSIETILAKSEGADLVEFDVSLTKDGVAVLLHDDTLERTTNCTGLVRDKLFEALRKNCNAAAKFKSARYDRS